MGFAQSSVFGSQVTLGAGLTDMRMLQRKENGKENVPTVSEHPLKAESPHRTLRLLFYDGVLFLIAVSLTYTDPKTGDLALNLILKQILSNVNSRCC